MLLDIRSAFGKADVNYIRSDLVLSQLTDELASSVDHGEGHVREVQGWLCFIHLTNENLTAAAESLGEYIQVDQSSSTCTMRCAHLTPGTANDFATGILLTWLSAYVHRWLAIGGLCTGDVHPLDAIQRAKACLSAVPNDPSVRTLLLALQLMHCRIADQTNNRDLASTVLEPLLRELPKELTLASEQRGMSWVLVQALEEAARRAWREGYGAEARDHALNAAAILARPDIRDDPLRGGVHYTLGRILSTFSRSHYTVALDALRAAEDTYSRLNHRFRYRTRIQIIQTLVKANRLSEAESLLLDVNDELNSEESKKTDRLSEIEMSYVRADWKLAHIWLLRPRHNRMRVDWKVIAAEAQWIINELQSRSNTRLLAEGRLHLGLAKLALAGLDEKALDQATVLLKTALKSAVGRRKIEILARLGLAQANYRLTRAGQDPTRRSTAQRSAHLELGKATRALRKTKSSFLEAYRSDVEREVLGGVWFFLRLPDHLANLQRHLEVMVYQEALIAKNFNKEAAARMLGIKQTTFHDHMDWTVPWDTGVISLHEWCERMKSAYDQETQ